MDEYNEKYKIERMMSLAERTIERLWITTIILILLLVGSNCAWLYYESQFKVSETTTIEAQQDGDGVNMVGGGDVTYGAESKDN